MRSPFDAVVTQPYRNVDARRGRAPAPIFAAQGSANTRLDLRGAGDQILHSVEQREPPTLCAVVTTYCIHSTRRATPIGGLIIL